MTTAVLNPAKKRLKELAKLGDAKLKIMAVAKFLQTSRHAIYQLIELGFFSEARWSEATANSHRRIHADEVLHYLELSEEKMPRDRKLAAMKTYWHGQGR